MSKTTMALEAAVAAVIVSMPKGDDLSSARQRAAVDRAFASILKLIAPRIRHFIRQYGLTAHWEDAEQCCAIAIHRAIQGYDPEKALFTTFVNWQIRGELQSLRFRIMTDQRPSAKKVAATTVSLHSVSSGADGEETTLESIIEDEFALSRTESAASDYLAHAATRSLIDGYINHQRAAALDQLRKRPRTKRLTVTDPAERATALLRVTRTHGICPDELDKLEQKLERDREIVERRVFQADTLDQLGETTGVTKERVRQITKRASRTIADIAASEPQFAVMAEYRKNYAKAARTRATKVNGELPKVSMLPAEGQPHNTLSRVIAIPANVVGASHPSLIDIDSIAPSAAPSTGTKRQGGNAPGSAARH